MICESWEGGTIAGMYPLLEWLGGWADHCVFLTVHQGIHRANIKLIPAGGADADAHLAYWETAKALSHPCLLHLMESGRATIHDTDVVYVLTEKTDTFLSSIIPRKALDASDAKLIFGAIVDALLFLHERGFGHGSVRPSNIVLVGDQWKLTPEKMAAAEMAGRKANEYEAPEVAAGELTTAADVWSLGMIIVEAFERQTPSWDSQAINDPVVPDSLPAPFLEIARACLRRDPAQRISISGIKALLAGDALGASEAELKPQRSEPVPVVEPEAKPKFEEEVAAEKAGSSGEAEPVEFAPRSRLFSNLGEEDERTGRKGAVVWAIVVLLVAVVVLAVRGYRGGFFRGVMQNVPAQSQPSPKNEAESSAPAQASPSQAAPTPQPQSAPQPQFATQPQSTPAKGEGEASTGGAGESASGSQPSQTQTAAAATKPLEPAQPSQPQAPPVTQPERRRPGAEEAAANSRGAVVTRVLPNVEQGAIGSMRAPVEVEFHVSVNEEGTVSNVEYLSREPGNYFARIAWKAAQLWKFKPPESEGHAEASEWVLLFKFDRTRTEATATELR